MSYTASDITDIYSQYLGIGSHITLYCWFEDTEGNKVDVTNPQAVIKLSGSPVTTHTVLESLKRVNPNDDEHKGHYSFKFLTDGMAESANYTIEFSGTYNGSPLLISGNFQLRAIPIVQEYINRLRSMLYDTRTSDYLLDDPTRFKWEDGMLYDFLRNSVNAINVIPPYGYQFTFESMPFIDLMLTGAMIEALFALARREIDNTLIYSDELSINIDRSAKYMSIAQALTQSWREAIKLAKTSYALTLTKPIGLKSTRLPYTILRPLSLREEMQNTFGGIL